MTDRGVHPDLLDEQETPQAAPEAPSPRRGRAARAAPQASSLQPPAAEPAESPPAPEATSEPAADAPESSPAEPTGPPEWWQQVKEASDPKAALALITKNLPKTELEQDPTLQGWIGDMSQRRALALQQQQEQERIEQQKREMLANGDYYGLGQLTAPELERRAQQLAAQQQGAPFMDGVTHFQSQLPAEVQAAVQGKTFGAGKSYAEGVSEYLAAVTEASVSHRLNDALEKELKRREPALRKAWLSESNGAQPVPELDGGRAASVREITDEQVDRMSLAEYDTYFDEQGKPRPGTRVRLTRGIPLTRR
jgi:hypothetical protein